MKNPVINQNPGNNQPRQIPLPSRDGVTNLQIHTLLDVASVLLGALIRPSFDETVPGSNPLDGGVKSAAEATLIHTCARLDTIIADSSRWNMDTQNTLETMLARMYAQNEKFQVAQTAAAEQMLKPHFRFKPLLISMSDGNYMVLLGNPNDIENAIVGIGSCPEEALQAFDDFFVGKLPDSTVRWLAEREAALDAGKTPPPFPKSKEQQNEPKMDGTRNRKTRKPKAQKKNHPGDSRGTGPNDKVGGSQDQPS